MDKLNHAVGMRACLRRNGGGPTSRARLCVEPVLFGDLGEVYERGSVCDERGDDYAAGVEPVRICKQRSC